MLARAGSVWWRVGARKYRGVLADEDDSAEARAGSTEYTPGEITEHSIDTSFGVKIPLDQYSVQTLWNELKVPLASPPVPSSPCLFLCVCVLAHTLREALYGGEYE